MKLRWIRNTDGKPDAVLTMAFMGFIVVLLKVLIGETTFDLGDHTYTFGGIDATVVGALLTPTLGAYVTRRWTEKRYAQESVPLKLEAQKTKDERDILRESIGQ